MLEMIDEEKEREIRREKHFAYLESKRIDVLEAIKPMCEAFNITDYDYEIKKTGQTETLRLNNTRIGCSSNSISAIIDELIGYIFITIYCHQKDLGHFSTQTKNVIRRYWLKD